MTFRICVIGGGIAGMAFVWQLSRLRGGIEVDLFDPQRPAQGAGVVMSPAKLEEYSSLFASLLPEVRRWDRLRIRTGDYCGWSGGHETVGIERQALVDRMRRAIHRIPGVRWHRHRLSALPSGYDLVVGADGSGSASRCRVPSVRSSGELVYLWCSVRGRLPALFDVVPLRDGHLVVHGYPHCSDRSTLVLEADPAALRAYGIDPDAPTEGWLPVLDELICPRLGCADLRPHTPGWRRFVTVRCERWAAGPLMLVGDAAHALHFSVGSGTSLALDDGRELAGCLANGGLAGFEAARREQVDAMMAEAEISRRWFERLARRHRLEGVRTAFALRSRRTANDIGYLGRRDPEFVARAVRELGLSASAGAIPCPRTAPLRVGPLSLRGRVLATGRDPDPDPATCSAALEGSASDGGARGVLVRGPAELPRVMDADFVAVPSAAGGRLDASEAADAVRGVVDRPVLLLDAHELPPRDIDTQLTAGAFDLYAAVPSELADLAAGSVLSLRSIQEASG